MKILTLCLAMLSLNFLMGCTSPVIQAMASEPATPNPSCGGSFTYIPSEYSAQQLAMFQQVQNEWNNYIGYEVVTLTPDYVKHEACQINVVDSITVEGQNFDGYFDANGGILRLTAKTYLDDQKMLTNLLAHEIGHALGMSHLEDSLMQANGYHEFSSKDREQLESLGY